MKKLLLGSVVLTVFSISLIIFQFSCKKDANAQTTLNSSNESASRAVCDIRGTYVGYNTSSTGNTASSVYKLQDNNFAVGSTSVDGPAVTFGGYRNTCDSVVMSVHYSGNDSYYLLKGKLKHQHTAISGTFQNLTNPSDYGTFTLTKQ